jgi:hypothetical protein
MKTLLIFSIIVITFISCNSDNEIETKTPILIADREAPLGWIYLRIYDDSTFEFESRNLRTSDFYIGKAKITEDTIYFRYTDSIPKAGKTAIYNDKVVAYIDGDYPEKVKIKKYSLK